MDEIFSGAGTGGDDGTIANDGSANIHSCAQCVLHAHQVVAKGKSLSEIIFNP